MSPAPGRCRGKPRRTPRTKVTKNLGRTVSPPKSGGDIRRHKMADVAAILRHLLDQRGTGVAELLVRHDEERFNLGLEMPVHQRHVELELEIGKGAKAADDGVRLLRPGEVDQQAVEGQYADIGKLRDVG